MKYYLSFFTGAKLIKLAKRVNASTQSRSTSRIWREEGGVMLLGMVLYMMTSRTLPRLSISIWNCPSIVFLCYVVYRRFCFGEWSFSSGDSYEWDRFLKDGEMRSEEASKLLVQTEMYVSKYTCKGRAPSLVWISGWSHSYWTSGRGCVFNIRMRKSLQPGLVFQGRVSSLSFSYYRMLRTPSTASLN